MKEFSKKQKKAQIEDNEDEIDREYKKIQKENKSNASSVESLMGESPSKYNTKNKLKFENDDEAFLSKIVKPMPIKSKQDLVRGTASEKSKYPESKNKESDSMNSKVFSRSNKKREQSPDKG
eukprot:CAMPEP_0170551176 /NCGR_PEP_ID=MMETSP0211-20121228/9202_1 /TAXON_ID=311385 /ORGANISM="Pseudokeronopsis sp., Strain OXSARD2" /LENGTH=121 /DNA_ID=CAMNT_0010858185 /DNA_START=2305 /DNA_END=2670 /DNA_ORIENTATION=+